MKRHAIHCPTLCHALLAALVLLATAVPSRADPALPPLTGDQAREDFDALVDKLRENHLGMYQYRDRGEIDASLSRLRGAIGERIDQRAFFRTVREVVALTDEGHAGVWASEAAEEAYGDMPSFLPLTLLFAGRDALPHTVPDGDRARFRQGERVVAIDGEPMAALMDDMLDIVATDGRNETFAFATVGGGWGFPIDYFLLRGPRERFEIELEAYGTGTRRTVELPAITGVELFEGERAIVHRPLDPPDFHYETLDCGVGYLAATNFIDLDDYEAWYREVFAQIAADDVPALVIDLSENVGGVEGNETLLASYLFEKPFKRYRFVSMTRRLYELLRAEGNDLDAWTLDGERASRDAPTLWTDHYEEFDYAVPEPRLVYDGPVVAITSGRTFSGGAEFAAMLRMRRRATFVGEETGGAYEGNVSGPRAEIDLAHSGITVPMPVIHYRMDVDPERPGRGVLPDRPVVPTGSDLAEGRNAPLLTALRVAERKADLDAGTCEPPSAE